MSWVDTSTSFMKFCGLGVGGDVFVLRWIGEWGGRKVGVGDGLNKEGSEKDDRGGECIEGVRH